MPRREVFEGRPGEILGAREGHTGQAQGATHKETVYKYHEYGRRGAGDGQAMPSLSANLGKFELSTLNLAPFLLNSVCMYTKTNNFSVILA